MTAEITVNDGSKSNEMLEVCMINRPTERYALLFSDPFITFAYETADLILQYFVRQATLSATTSTLEEM